MMKVYKTEEEYNRHFIDRFKSSDEPDILIVVDKLLTGFDAPRNTVLYLCRTLKEHTLLQAIARVNRLFEDETGGPTKEFGYIIDYANILGELDTALAMYSRAGLENFDPDDLADTLTSIKAEIGKLPQNHSDLCDFFKQVKNQKDEEALEQYLADEALRDEFYERLKVYRKSLSIALSSQSFIMNESSEKIQLYRHDLKRFENLRLFVKQRYCEAIDYREHEPKIQKILDMHIQADRVTVLNEAINIFDDQLLSDVKQGKGITASKSQAARADMIAHATKKVITEKLEEDPIFYEKFSKLIQKVIDDFRAKRISDLEYIQQASEIRDKVAHKKRENTPEPLMNNEEALAYYGIGQEVFQKQFLDCEEAQKYSVDLALNIQNSIKRHRKVQFWQDLDAQNKVKNDIEDYLYDEVRIKNGINLATEQMDEIIERSMKVAMHRTLE